jgi:hypothetical protein
MLSGIKKSGLELFSTIKIWRFFSVGRRLFSVKKQAPESFTGGFESVYKSRVMRDVRNSVPRGFMNIKTFGPAV